MIDLARLAAVPDAAVPRSPATEAGIDGSAAYLASDEALRSIELDPYWPKWHSPWWHMRLLHELGETRQIPARTAAAMAARMDRLLHSFPIDPEEKRGVDLQRDIACHCALGGMLPVLAACGVDVDRALPWVEPWFERYQMADGGLNCDETAYLVKDECPSSIVATVAVLEAMSIGAWSPRRRAVADRAARLLLDRGLVRGSETVHNAAERRSAPLWPVLTFPRFYYYDVLRGLAALVIWAEKTGQPLPIAPIAGAIEGLLDRWPDGVVAVERQAHADRMTILPLPDGSKSGDVPTSSFPLLDAVSRVGEPSEALTGQWSAVRAGLLRVLSLQVPYPTPAQDTPAR